MFDRFTPRFVKRYAELHQAMDAAFTSFRDEVLKKAFPTPAHSVEMDDADWKALLESLEAS
jgi:3-methyl-2-oxobutanoate hydroxymethyltransferase